MLDLLIELVVLSGGTRFGWGCFRGLCRVGSVFPWTLLNRFRAFCLSGGGC